MKELLTFETRKILRSKALYICITISFAFLLLSAAAIFIGMEIQKAFALEEGIDITAVEEMFASNSAFDIMLSTLSSSSLSSIFGIFAVIFLCDDYSQKTIKNVYSHGFTRDQVFFSKIIVVAIAAFAAYLLMIILGFFTGLTFFGKVGESANVMIFVDQFIILLCNVSLAAFLCFTFKKISVSVVLLIFAPGIIGLLFSIADIIINSDTFHLANYWFGNFELLIYKNTSAENILTVLIGGAAYVALFTFLGLLINRKNKL